MDDVNTSNSTWFGSSYDIVACLFYIIHVTYIYFTKWERKLKLENLERINFIDWQKKQVYLSGNTIHVVGDNRYILKGLNIVYHIPEYQVQLEILVSCLFLLSSSEIDVCIVKVSHHYHPHPKDGKVIF